MGESPIHEGNCRLVFNRSKKVSHEDLWGVQNICALCIELLMHYVCDKRSFKFVQLCSAEIIPTIAHF